ncbi:putative RNA-binding protein 19 [Trichinella sp. T9]|nr:putative RNA-binding protein 19 [Trichinella sp. T9]
MHRDDVEGESHSEETTSRLIVKNLPKNYKETHFRALFEEYGTLTDCQLRFNEQNNNFRGFGFVGFQNADDAKAAKNALDNTFVKSSRIKVEYCHPLCSSVSKNDKRVQSKNKSVASGKTVIRIQCQFPLKRKHLLVFLSPIKPCKIILVDDGLTALVYLQRKGDATAIIKRNGSYICGNKIEISLDDKTSAHHEDDKNAFSSKRRQYPAENPKQQADLIAESGCIFLRNLPYQCTEEDLKNWLETFGPIAEVNFHVDSKTGKPKGFALVKFVFPENALKVFTECDGSIFQGRVVHILAGFEDEDETKNAKSEENDDDDTATFKEAKERKQQQAACDKRTWNSLFLGVNAVADIMAETLDVEKGAILNVHCHSSLGVRMALGESRIVRETREFLEQNGVQLESFSGNLVTKRSTNVMLVKNLPAKTETAQIRRLFGKFGRLGRVVLPPSGLTAIVEFLLDSDAKTAFQNLAFKRFGKTALFLEWAPDDVFSSKLDSAKATGEEEKQEANEQQHHHHQQQADNNNRLFVKNLSADTSDEDLAEFFKKIGPVLSATVAKKYCKSTAGKMIQCSSLRYGFVEYENDQHAQEAIRRLQNGELKGSIIQIQLSKRQTSSSSTSVVDRRLSIVPYSEKTKPRSQTKIIVRNIPFQASVKEITKLFKVFGNVQSVRLPKKSPNGQHRGFGFVEFNCKADAEKAFKHLGVSTHLYGRRLVLEWADLEGDLQELRDKTAEYFTLGSRRKRVKFEIE